ncbi:ABC transporter ATP-binding protein [Kribbella sp. NPDC050820]|uniref:ABC transporter ATP-binding protein n=1 Tax=Kribbella sp. NPDC050820 TaxID=3155408 RepID=UPI0033EDF033
MTEHAVIDPTSSAGRDVANVSTANNTDGYLAFDKLVKTYGDTTALRDVSLTVRDGDFVSILGPSGSGKTTLLGILAGFVQPDSGDVRLAGRDLIGVPPDRRNLGVVFQNYALFPHMTVRQNVAFPLEARSIRRAEVAQRVSRALDLVELSNLGHRRPAELSGGQQQRVALARALVYEPPVLLLDEPLGALDRRLREAMQVELKDLHDRVKSTFLYVTHDQEEALAMSDVVVVMRDGQIEQIGSPEDVYDRPVSRFVAHFVGDCNLIDGTVEPGPQGWQVRSRSGNVVLWSGSDKPAAGDCCVAVRPERLDLTSEPPGAAGCIEATVLSRRFAGRELAWRCASPLGDLIVRLPRTFTETRQAGVDHIYEGSTVTLRIDVDRTHVLNPDATGNPTPSDISAEVATVAGKAP